MKKHGFTLMELLVAMAIILILVAMLVASLSRARGQRQILLAQKQVKEITAAAAQYYDQLGCYPPDTGAFTTGAIPDTVVQSDAIYQYLGKKLVDQKSGKEYGPFLDILPQHLNGNLYVDPWGSPYQLDAFHVQMVDVKQGVFQRIGEPYAGAAPEKDVRDVKVWSFGPDLKGGLGSAAPVKRVGDDADNIVSWE